MKKPTYWDYLKLPSLLTLQGGLEEDEARLQPDELHFIVVHQVYELWFKLVLRELRLAIEHLSRPRVPEETIPYVVHHLKRVNEILKLAVDQFRIVETLTPQDFLDFRDKLAPSSGFQSFQMREIEILLGLEDGTRARYGTTEALSHIREASVDSPGGDFALEHVEAARKETTLRQALHAWLYRTPIQGSSAGDAGDGEAVSRFLASYFDAAQKHAAAQQAWLPERLGAEAGAVAARLTDGLASARLFLEAGDAPEAERDTARRVRAGLLFIESYRELPLLAWPRLLVDSIVELEEYLVLWRTRHARMVERTIGRRPGTGGSSGVDYLDQTAKTRIFTELWAVRTLLLPREFLPALENTQSYGFAKA